jgi:phosphate-selective porin OprO/OprP
MEAPTAEVLATAFGGGDARSAIGVRSYKTQYWAGAFVTGPAAGATHTATTSGQSEPAAFLARVTYNPIQNDMESVHIGANIGHVINTGSANAAGSHTFTLSDRSELRVDPTTLVTTGAMTNVKGATVYGAELAAQYDHFFAQGEYYWYEIDRSGTQSGTTTGQVANGLNFDGGYVEASYSIGGKRKYNAGAGAYSGVSVDHPLSLKDGSGWGALELAGRFSMLDLNDKFATNTTSANNPGIGGGQEKIYSVGLNYYPYNNIKLMLDWIHTDVTRQSTAAASVSNGFKSDAIAGRFQVAW